MLIWRLARLLCHRQPFPSLADASHTLCHHMQPTSKCTGFIEDGQCGHVPVYYTLSVKYNILAYLLTTLRDTRHAERSCPHRDYARRTRMVTPVARHRMVQRGIILGLAWVVGLIVWLPWAHAQSAKPMVELTTAIMQVAKQTIPAVVHIEVTERQEVTNPLSPFENDPFLQRFFGGRQLPKKFRREVKGLGSGMIMDAAGHILTNAHVVGSSSKIEVLLANGHQHTARVIGTDPKTDLAVIKIDTKEALSYVTF